MNEFPSITVNADATLVTVEYAGHITAENMRVHAAQTEELAGRLKPGFVVLTDLSRLEKMDPDCTPLISQVMDRYNLSGVGRVIRVMPNPKKDIGLGILSLFHYKRGIPVNTVTTLAEAMKLL
jgi:hypothetical protein